MMIRALSLMLAAAIAAPALAAEPVPVPPPPPIDAAAAPRPDRAAMREKLQAMDTDHDGKWSKAEWLAGGRKERGFDRLDANHDGFVTPDELRAGMAAMRAARTQDMPLPPPTPAE